MVRAVRIAYPHSHLYGNLSSEVKFDCGLRFSWVININNCNELFLNVLPRYIVYDVAQVNLKYLLKLKFNYKTSLW